MHPLAHLKASFATACLLILAMLLISTPASADPNIIALPAGESVQNKNLFTAPSPLASTNSQQNINQRQAQILYPYALASLMAHSYKLNRSDRSQTQMNFERLKFLKLEPLTIGDLATEESKKHFHNNESQRFSHKGSGLQARAFIHRKSGTVIVAFAGTDFERSYRSAVTISAAVKISWGYRHRILTEARHLCARLQNLPDIKQIILTGLSLGGAVAQYAGIACDLPVVAFNSLALPKILRQDAYRLGSTLRKEKNESITQALDQHLQQTIFAEVEGEYLNNKETWGNWLIQNPHPEGAMIFTIPPAREEESHRNRHWAPQLVDALEKASRYQFSKHFGKGFSLQNRPGKSKQKTP